MNTSHLTTFLARKGQIVTVSWAKAMKSLRGQPVVTKHVTTQARAGVTYDNMHSVIAGRASGELPKENAGLPWGKWATLGGVSLFPHVIEHTVKGQLKHYLRFAVLNGGNPMQVRYESEGKTISASDARRMTLASEWSKEAVSSVFNVSVGNIVSIQ